MGTPIYGIDPDAALTPDMVRDALIECFYEAHCLATGLTNGTEDVNRSYCRMMVEKAFNDVGGDIDHPTKASILGVMGKLAELSRKFRGEEIIRKHQADMQALVDRLP